MQRALKKLEGVDITTVCSTHGPVWRAELPKVIDLYDRLSRYQPLDNGVTIVYGSMYGNTERMAESAAEALAEAGIKNIVIRNAAKTDLSYILADLFTHAGVVVAAPTYSDGLFPPVEAVMTAMSVRGIKNRHIALIGSHTWAPQSIKKMNAHLEACGLTPIAEPVSAKQAPSDDVISKCRALASSLAEVLK